MSYPTCHNAYMKLNRLNWLRRKEGGALATLGGARLVKHLDGKIELIGGTPADHTAAKEWISLFLHDAVVSFPPSAKPPVPQSLAAVPMPHHH